MTRTEDDNDDQDDDDDAMTRQNRVQTSEREKEKPIMSAFPKQCLHVRGSYSAVTS